MRIVAHVDMDAFFAAIEERDRPELRGRPIAIGADPQAGRGRGVLSTANYVARAYGLHSALPISQAWRLSEAARRRGQPPVVYLRPNMTQYRTVSSRVMALLRQFAAVVEPASIDEAYLDLSAIASVEEAAALCRRIKQAIHDTEQLTLSVGLGPNKLVAKIASGIQKPDGLTVVDDAAVDAFLAPLPVRVIPGIGPKTDAALARQGVTVVRDLRPWSRERLAERFGKRGAELYDRIRGRDDEPVSAEWTPKSVGEQETFAHDTRETTFLIERLAELCRGVESRFTDEGFTSFRTVVLTVRFADFETVSRSHSLATPTANARVLQAEALKLFLPFLDQRENPRRKAIRLLGVRVERLE